MNNDTETTQATGLGSLEQVIARAQQLIDARPAAECSPAWVHEAAHVGDLSVLALALRR